MATSPLLQLHKLLLCLEWLPTWSLLQAEICCKELRPGRESERDKLREKLGLVWLSVVYIEYILIYRKGAILMDHQGRGKGVGISNIECAGSFPGKEGSFPSFSLAICASVVLSSCFYFGWLLVLSNRCGWAGIPQRSLQRQLGAT